MPARKRHHRFPALIYPGQAEPAFTVRIQYFPGTDADEHDPKPRKQGGIINRPERCRCYSQWQEPEGAVQTGHQEPCGDTNETQYDIVFPETIKKRGKNYRDSNQVQDPKYNISFTEVQPRSHGYDDSQCKDPCTAVQELKIQVYPREFFCSPAIS